MKIIIRTIFFFKYLIYIQFILLLLFFFQTKLSLHIIFSRKSSADWLDTKIAYNARRMLKLTGFVLGLKPVYLNLPEEFDIPKDKQFLIISNHQSLLDILIIKSLFINYKIRFILKKSLTKGYPYISAVIRTQRHCAIDRTNSKQSIPELKRIAKLSKEQKRPLVLFPEGTRGRLSDTVGEFKTAAARTILRKNPMPVVIIVLQNGFYLPTLFSHSYFPQKNYYIKVMKYYPEVTSAEITDLLADARDSIQNEIEYFNQREHYKINKKHKNNQ